MKKIKEILFQNTVTVFFIIMCTAAYIFAAKPLSFVLSEILIRLCRNLVIVLSLIIPVTAGLGLNFSIVLGAMAAQVALVFVTHWKTPGISGILLCVAISVPLAIIFGFWVGKLFNKTKGQEMITGMITGFFANGIYEFFFLILVGKIIPMVDEEIIIVGGVGVKDTIVMQPTMQGVLDNLWKISLDKVLLAAYIAIAIYLTTAVLFKVYKYIKVARQAQYLDLVKKYSAYFILCTALILLCNLNETIKFALSYTDVPMISVFIVILVCMFCKFITVTKLGQDFRSVGQNMRVANAAGIHVNSRRIVAIIISTVLAALGQLIFLQNLGTFTTYSGHDQVGTFAVAAILVGGASVRKATVSQAILGTILFHTLFVLAPMAGKNLFNDAMYGEYFRVFVAYGVIAVTLVMHAVNASNAKRSDDAKARNETKTEIEIEAGAEA
jgi:simple sugar transport system permease protein